MAQFVVSVLNTQKDWSGYPFLVFPLFKILVTVIFLVAHITSIYAPNHSVCYLILVKYLVERELKLYQFHSKKAFNFKTLT